MRSVRAAKQGSYYANELICGYPCSTWISLTEEIYSFNSNGYTFNGWPDGQPLIEQEQCVVEIVKTVLSEILKVIRDGKKQN